MKTTATNALGWLLLLNINGCGQAPVPGTATNPAAAAAPADAEPHADDAPAVLASDGGIPPAFPSDVAADTTGAELLQRFEGQLRFADGVSEALKRTALSLDDPRLDRQISAIDERLGVLRARLDELRHLEPSELEGSRAEWVAAMEEVRSMCRRARSLADELGG